MMNLIIILISFLFVATTTHAIKGLELANAVSKAVVCVNDLCEVQISNSTGTFTFRENSGWMHLIV
jgi:hypothetical protein